MISLDEIREVSNGEVGVDESPRVEDQEIFGAVLGASGIGGGGNGQVGSVTTISRPSRSSR